MILTPYLLFLFCVIAATFWILASRKRREEPSAHEVVCPESRDTARVETDTRHALLSFFQGHSEAHLKSCSRWPERTGCDEACIPQLEPQLKVDDILAKWYDGKNCALCSMPLGRTDWLRGSAAALDGNDHFVPLRDMDWTKFPMLLEGYRPLCRKCHAACLEKRRAAKAVGAST